MKIEAGRGPSRLFLFLVVFSLAGSTFSRLTHLDPGPIAPIISLLTIAVGIWATFDEYLGSISGAKIRLFATLAFGASSEILGLATGFPFGPYSYTRVWWPTVELPVGPFPLALPFAWLLMAGSATLSWGRAPLRAVLGGLLAAAIDLAMEPVMAGPLHYWRWRTVGPLPGGAPVANFLGWWAVGTLAGLILTFRTPPVRPVGPRWVLAGFAVLIVGLGLIGKG